MFPVFGFINERDGHVDGKKGGNLVLEFEYDYVLGCEAKVDLIINKTIIYMK